MNTYGMGTYSMGTYGMGTYSMGTYGMVTYGMGTWPDGYQDCPATASATLFLVLRCQEHKEVMSLQEGVSINETKLNYIFCRILLLVTQRMAPPVAVTQPQDVWSPTAQ